ncbi:hypothetical protein KP509_07G034400 [Ceratopteris richardii]|uniref:Tify domain-containing protein n=1 Tax=Ceratopteris richardii TaxID=49495 RepID=A0A8T2UB97_CERRI|nr:hypothetical protein KP509_07G034400 [Ceratopteris richardii]KAH7432683.1 hypothetical protein KP509_07G034400 [Ceratopteris richardii]
MTMNTLDLLGILARRDSDSLIASGPAKRTPDLTIFYLDTVNVYNRVPSEKAHAIMHLAASCSGRHNHNADNGSTLIAEATTTLDTSSMGIQASNPVSTMTCFPSIGGSATIKQSFSRTSAPSPSSPVQVLQAERKPGQFISQRTQAKLSFARRSSLARFLEKRKISVHIQAEKSAEEEIIDHEAKKLKR